MAEDSWKIMETVRQLLNHKPAEEEKDPGGIVYDGAFDQSSLSPEERKKSDAARAFREKKEKERVADQGRNALVDGIVKGFAGEGALVDRVQKREAKKAKK